MLLRKRITLVACLAASVVPACRTSSESTSSAPIAAALQSCGETPGSKAASATRWSGAVRAFAKFSLFIPDSARVTATDSLVGLAWPGCPNCSFGVAIRPDSGIGLDARVARLVAAQHAIDSSNAIPGALQQFDVINGRPEPFATPTERGYFIQDDCGDCVSRTLLFGRSGFFAEVGLGVDDNVADVSRHLCEMIVVAKTFTWR